MGRLFSDQRIFGPESHCFKRSVRDQECPFWSKIRRARGNCGGDSMQSQISDESTTVCGELFVDSAPGFGYSGDLARCCAWGLCRGPQRQVFVDGAFIRTSWLIPLTGVGWSRPPATEGAARFASSVEPEPDEGQPRQFSPEQICLEVG